MINAENEKAIKLCVGIFLTIMIINLKLSVTKYQLYHIIF